MKRNLLAIFISIGAMCVFNTHSHAQATLVYYWDFNNMDSSARSPHYSAPGTSGAHYEYHCSYIDYNSPGDTFLNIQMGDTAGACLKARNPSDSLVFFMPTTYFQNIHLSYAEQRTTNGAQTNSVHYTVDGIHFIPSSVADAVDSSTYTTILNTWTLYTFNFSSDALTKNNPNFAVSIVFSNGNTNTSGNNRFDNVALKGDVIPGLSVLNQSTEVPTYQLYPNPVLNVLNINTSLDGEKSIAIYNVVGQKVYEGTEQTQQSSINTSAFNAGVYYINIRENSTGATTTMKFIK
jgi:hypothetical protein